MFQKLEREFFDNAKRIDGLGEDGDAGGAFNELAAARDDIIKRLIATRARDDAGVLAKLRVALHLVERFEHEQPEWRDAWALLVTAANSTSALCSDVPKATPACSAYPERLARIADDMEGHICAADQCSTAMDLLIDYVDRPADREQAGGLRFAMQMVSEDLMTEVQQARRLYYKLHQALHAEDALTVVAGNQAGDGGAAREG